jgi:tetratricopeptide (TPR) repeat protein
MLRLERAEALIGLGRFDEARSTLRELLGTEPDLAPAWCLLARAQIGLGEMEAALESAERGVALAPDNDWPHRLRSVALERLGDTDGAITAAREAVAKGPHEWQTHKRLALVLVHAKRDPDFALAAAGRAAELAPNEADAHCVLGLAHDARGEKKEAERCFRQALALDPQHSASLDALARRQLAMSRFGRAGNLAAAASGFRDVVHSDPYAAHGAANLELVLRVFLARLSYLVFVIVWIASRATGGTLGARLGPLVLLAVPVAFAARFLTSLAPDLRRQVRYVAFHGRLAAPSYAQSLAISLLLVSATAPSGARTGIGIAAVVISFAARLLLARRSGGLRFSSTSSRIVVGAVGVIVLYFVGATLGGFNPVRGLLFVVGGALLTLFSYGIRQRRRV